MNRFFTPLPLTTQRFPPAAGYKSPAPKSPPAWGLGISLLCQTSGLRASAKQGSRPNVMFSGPLRLLDCSATPARHDPVGRSLYSHRRRRATTEDGPGWAASPPASIWEGPHHENHGRNGGHEGQGPCGTTGRHPQKATPDEPIAGHPPEVPRLLRWEAEGRQILHAGRRELDKMRPVAISVRKAYPDRPQAPWGTVLRPPTDARRQRGFGVAAWMSREKGRFSRRFAPVFVSTSHFERQRHRRG